MPSAILKRIAAETGVPRLLPILADDLSPADMQSLLLAVFQARARSMRVPDVMTASGGRPLFAPSTVDARVLHAFDRCAYDAAAGFEALDLAPVAPFGTCAALGAIDQNNVLTTIRRAEVLGDNTSALALACAARRRHPAGRDASTVRLCNSHRVVRLQPFDVPAYSPHFRLFALASAGRDTGSHAFECDELRAHLASYLTLFRALNTHGFHLVDPLVEISDVRITGALLDQVPGAREEARSAVRAHRPGVSDGVLARLGLTLPADVVDPVGELRDVAARHGLEHRVFGLARIKTACLDGLAREFPEARFRFNLARLEGLGYYNGPCLRISPATRDGARFALVDGGVLDWTAQLLQDRKERFLASGIGTELACKVYRG